MCGISGTIEYARLRQVDGAALLRMNQTLEHRGPNDAGSYISTYCGVAMRRLSIIDVAGGHQPIANETEDVRIVMNGEIYNYLALRKELEARGHRFRTQSDTEAILHLYEDHGNDCVRYLDGMFAFAICDERESKQNPHLLVARDRIGKKPLYYTDAQGTFLFASEIKALLADGRVRKDLDREAVSQYLSLLVIPAPYSIFESVRKLPAGHLLTCDENGPRIERYWNYLDYVGDQDISEHEAVGEIRRLLFEAVKKRLMSEVPLGAFLSGGLDSSTVVAMMCRLQNKKVATFSIGFEGSERHNELPWARIVAEHCRTDHHEFFLKPDIVESLDDVVRYADEPFAISSAIPTLQLSKQARKSVTVILTGDGGDEVFAGYEHYVYERWAHVYRLAPVVIDSAMMGAAKLLPRNLESSGGRLRRRLERFVGAARLNPAARRLSWATAFSAPEIDSLLGTNGMAAPETESFLGRLSQDLGNVELAKQCNCFDVLLWLPDEMLTKVDRMTMGASLEARCPLLDWKLVEFMAKLPFRTKFKGWSQKGLKHLLRSTVRDLLPASLFDRPKQGFNIPLDLWFRGGLSRYAEDLLSPQRVKSRGVFDSGEVSRLLELHKAGGTNASNRLYALMVFEAWAATYF